MDQKVIDYCRKIKLEPHENIYEGGGFSPTGMQASWAVIDEGKRGGLTNTKSKAICHASCSRMCTPETVAIKTYVMEDRPLNKPGGWPPEFLHGFYKWMLNDSPYSAAYVTKDSKEAVESGVIVDPNAPGGIVLGALILSRMPAELYGKTKAPQVFFDLVQAGVEETLAAIVAFSIENNYRYTDLCSPPHVCYQFCQGIVWGGHSPFTGMGLTTDSYQRMLNKAPRVDDLPYKTHRTGVGCWRSYQDGGTCALEVPLRKVLDECYPAERSGGWSGQLLLKSDPMPFEEYFLKVVEVVRDWQNKAIGGKK